LASTIVWYVQEGKVNLETEGDKLVQITEVNYHSQVKKNESKVNTKAREDT
jgi:hypothetical protein